MTSYQGHPDQNFGCVTYSQNGEDLMLLNIFKILGIDKPSYLDLGAHHPTTISNTRLLYEHGSRGVNIEANPNLLPNFTLDRAEDINVNVGVGEFEGDALFYMYSDTSGRNTFSNKEVESMERVLTPRARITIPVITVNQIVEKYCGGVFPNLLLCDIEGWDFRVLASADFKKHYKPAIICVEVRAEKTAAMVAMLHSKGFVPLCRMGENIILTSYDSQVLVARLQGYK